MQRANFKKGFSQMENDTFNSLKSSHLTYKYVISKETHR